MDSKHSAEDKLTPYRSQTEVEEGTVTVNTSGHAQELERNFSIVSICAVGYVLLLWKMSGKDEEGKR